MTQAPKNRKFRFSNLKTLNNSFVSLLEVF